MHTLGKVVVIPKKMQPQILSELHASIVKLNAVVHRHVWWLSSDIEWWEQPRWHREPNIMSVVLPQ